MNFTQLLSPELAQISRHPLAVLFIIVAWWGFSGGVDALPAPAPMGPKWYPPLYGAAHAICGNLKRVIALFHQP